MHPKIHLPAELASPGDHRAKVPSLPPPGGILDVQESGASVGVEDALVTDDVGRAPTEVAADSPAMEDPVGEVVGGEAVEVVLATVANLAFAKELLAVEVASLDAIGFLIDESGVIGDQRY